MWADNETAQDFLNFGGIAKAVAEITIRGSSMVSQSNVSKGRISD